MKYLSFIIFLIFACACKLQATTFMSFNEDGTQVTFYMRGYFGPETELAWGQWIDAKGIYIARVLIDRVGEMTIQFRNEENPDTGITESVALAARIEWRGDPDFAPISYGRICNVQQVGNGTGVNNGGSYRRTLPPARADMNIGDLKIIVGGAWRSDPRDPPVNIHRLGQSIDSNSMVRVSVSTVYDLRYQLEYSENCAPDNWHDLGEEIEGKDSLIEFDDPIALPTRFYRYHISGFRDD